MRVHFLYCHAKRHSSFVEFRAHIDCPYGHGFYVFMVIDIHVKRERNQYAPLKVYGINAALAERCVGFILPSAPTEARADLPCRYILHRRVFYILPLRLYPAVE